MSEVSQGGGKGRQHKRISNLKGVFLGKDDDVPILQLKLNFPGQGDELAFPVYSSGILAELFTAGEKEKKKKKEEKKKKKKFNSVFEKNQMK